MTSFKPTEEQQSILDTVASQKDASIMMKADAGCAKALRADQSVITPNGSKNIGDIEIGELIVGTDGKHYPVTGKFTQGIKELFEIGFSDGSKVVASADHIWPMQRSDHRRFGRTTLRTTAELKKTARVKAGPACAWGDGTRARWFANFTKPVNFRAGSKLPIDPWFLGILLGDGHLGLHSVSFSSADAQIVSDMKVIATVDFDLKMTKYGEQDYHLTTREGAKGIPGKTGIFNPLLASIQSFGLAGTKAESKFIPSIYRLASIEDRISILQGLLDSDGYADESRAVFTTASSLLASDVHFLVESLGGTVTRNEFTTTNLLAFRLHIKLPEGICPFRLERKKANYWVGQRGPYRAIEYIKQVEDGEAVCIKVASSDNCFLTNNFIPTHNSSTLRMMGPFIKESTLGMAFNKSTAQEMQGQMPANFLWKTANGLGHGAWIRANPSVTKWIVDDRKLGKLVSQVAKNERAELNPEQWDQVRQLTSGAMLAGLTPDNIGRPLIRDEPENWQEIADNLWIDKEDTNFFVALARQVLIESISLARKGTISFDDQVYCSVCLGGRFTQYDGVMTDESQDLNYLNHMMVAASLRPGARLFAVGDPKQSVYAFRGAVNESMERMRGLRTKWVDLPLHVTFRCPKVVVERQQSHAPGFKAFHSNPDGRFARLPGDLVPLDNGFAYEDDRTWGWEELQAQLPRSGASLAILCRNNAPLMSMAFKLIRRRVGVKMLGRQLGKNLITFSKKIVKEDLLSAEKTAILLTDWLEKERSLLIANDKESEVEGIEDRVECLRAVLSDAEARTAGDMRRIVSDLFAKEDGLVTLGSGHRAKGLEWDTVLHLDPWRIPSKQAKRAQARGNPVPMQQDKNLHYVMETRTRHTLAEANLEDFQ